MVKSNYSEAFIDSLDLEKELVKIQENCNRLESPLTFSYRFFKRIFDILGSLIGIVVLSPILLIVSFVIKIDTGENIIYKQKRVGRNGIPFYIYKFQTMVPNADKIGPSITTDSDPRITRSGKWLRKYKIDELPQLFNVLKGDMSFVGPRPEVPRYVVSYSLRSLKILKVKPGITDLSSIKLRDEEEYIRLKTKDNPDVEDIYLQFVLPEKLGISLTYLDEANFLKDLKLIMKTVSVVFK